MKRISTFITLILLLCQLTEAKVKLPVLVADGMVLQREQSINIWGWADPNEEVTVTFLKKKHKTTATPQGQWSITLPPLKAGGPHVMTINEVKLSNILIGDVFLCSGQSNMELPIARVMDLYAKEVAEYTNTQIHHIKVPLAYNFQAPQDDIRAAEWKPVDAANVKSIPALGYFFAKQWHHEQGVPVGMINAAVGGSPVEAWISEEALTAFPKYINDYLLYKSDEYMADIRRMENKRNALWNAILYRTDAGINEPVKWFDPHYDDSNWDEADLLDTSWNNNGVNAVNGSFWFRRNFNVPDHLAASEAILRMGCMVDADSVFVNGTFVGNTFYQYPPRIYKIPAGLLHKGTNQITVRLLSYEGRPHFVPEKPYKLVFDNQEISLEGRWKHRLGSPMPPLPGQTFFQYKPVGLYNAMIAPLLNYATKGVIWYQGESNVDRHNEYAELLTTLINDWRQRFDNPTLPFVIVELAGFGAPTDHAMQAEWDALRAAQRRVAHTVPNAALAPAKDLGEWNDIHPLNKKDVALRVAEEMKKLTNKHINQPTQKKK